MKKYCIFVSLTLVIVLTSCSKHVTDPLVSNTYFSQWNECTALSALKDYVDDVTNPKSPNFIKVEDRIATIAAIKNETGSWRWALFAAIYTTAVAWLVSMAVYQIGRLFI